MRLPLPRLARLVTRPPGAHLPAPGELERIDRLVTLAPRLVHPIVRTGCLTRGLTLYWFLRRSGFDAELRFGIDPSGAESTDGHCWVALDGEPILERRDPRPRFAETYRLPLTAA